MRNKKRLAPVEKIPRSPGRRNSDKFDVWLKKLTVWCLAAIAAMGTIYFSAIGMYMTADDKWQEMKARHEAAAIRRAIQREAK